MSVVWSDSNGWILCHSKYLNEVYGTFDSTKVCTFCGKYDVFHVHSPFLKHGQKYQNVESSEKTEVEMNSSDELEESYVKAMYYKILSEATRNGLSYFTRVCPRQYLESENSTAISIADRILNESVCLKSKNFNGENTNNHSISISFQENNYFIPPNCKFYGCSVDVIKEKFKGEYDVILLDPPWWNKHVRRKNANMIKAGYKLMYNDKLLEVPVNSLLSKNGLVVVWCTNSQRHVHDLINTIFPVWNVEYVCSWYWIKVTETGQPICEFTFKAGRKKPYERIIFGARKNRCKDFKNPEADKLIMSIPSAVHSHKPPLSNVLSEYIPFDAQCLEIFARYLLPNWTSTGDEVLKLQHEIFFVNQESNIV